MEGEYRRLGVTAKARFCGQIGLFTLVNVLFTRTYIGDTLGAPIKKAALRPLKSLDFELPYLLA